MVLKNGPSIIAPSPYPFPLIFSVCAPPPRLVGAYHLHPETHVSYFLMNYNVMTRAL